MLQAASLFVAAWTPIGGLAGLIIQIDGTDNLVWVPDLMFALGYFCIPVAFIILYFFPRHFPFIKKTPIELKKEAEEKKEAEKEKQEIEVDIELKEEKQ